jgi:4-hydroxybenzoate polyprenyltransferase
LSGHTPRANLNGPASSTPLCVDLDGTLVRSDTLLDLALVLARQNPRKIFSIPGWIAQGKAAFKRHLIQFAMLDVAALPYNRPLLAFCQTQHELGRPIYLATAADSALAQRVADHCGFFAGVLGSDGTHNLAGENKLAAFRQRFGEDFSYIGNASADIPILRVCREPMVANPTSGLMAGLRASHTVPARIFRDQAPPLKAWLKAVRLHQWAKNALIFLPLLLAHAWRSPGPLVGAILAFFAFGFCASGTYILNDLLDIEADRRHHTKQRRPFAAGHLSPLRGVLVIALFLTLATTLAIALPYAVAHFGTALRPAFGLLAWLLIYALSTISYSLALKRLVLIDVIVLSGLYTIRIIAGAAATNIPVSTWLAGFSVFFFLSLAFVKRFAELESLKLRGQAPTNGRGYRLEDLEQLRSFGTTAAYASVVVLMFYISSLNERLYHHPGRLWLLLPVLLLWVSQLWLLASRGELHEDPVVYAITDRRSLLLGIVVVAIVLLAL